MNGEADVVAVEFSGELVVILPPDVLFLGADFDLAFDVLCFLVSAARDNCLPDLLVFGMLNTCFNSLAKGKSISSTLQENITITIIRHKITIMSINHNNSLKSIVYNDLILDGFPVVLEIIFSLSVCQ